MTHKMNATFLNGFALTLAFLVAASSARADQTLVSDGGKTETIALASEPGLEAFAEAYISARNARDAQKVKGMYHPADLAALLRFAENQPTAPGQARPSLDAMILQNTVPERHPPLVVQRYLKDSPLPQAGFMDWPVPPTHFLQFSYSTGPNSTAVFLLHVARVDGRWFVVGGAPGAEFLKKMSPAR